MYCLQTLAKLNGLAAIRITEAERKAAASASIARTQKAWDEWQASRNRPANIDLTIGEAVAVRDEFNNAAVEPLDAMAELLVERRRALAALVAQIDASRGTSADYAALQEHITMRTARAVLSNRSKE